MMPQVPAGQVQGIKYIWVCPCHQDPLCLWCFGGNQELLVQSLSISRGQQYYGNLKAFLGKYGEEIAQRAQNIINSSGRFTPRNLLEITDDYLPRHRTKIIAEWLEECHILPIGTYEKMKMRGFRPTLASAKTCECSNQQKTEW